MIEHSDIRWQQRFFNYRKALTQLKEVAGLEQPSKFEEQGLIKAFEFTYELAWNTLKDFLVYQGYTDLVGSRDTLRTAFSQDLVSDGRVWMKMIESRNKTSHTYNEKTAREIVTEVKETFLAQFIELEITLSKRLVD
ncbi:nucleotidyltransferase substrate binding protein [Pontiellaceae bacterium B12227]|nr:nucleotidyltransferase substrate binding protein [Pontiellaceae bacterium B12227]